MGGLYPFPQQGKPLQSCTDTTTDKGWNGTLCLLLFDTLYLQCPYLAGYKIINTSYTYIIGWLEIEGQYKYHRKYYTHIYFDPRCTTRHSISVLAPIYIYIYILRLLYSRIEQSFDHRNARLHGMTLILLNSYRLPC